MTIVSSRTPEGNPHRCPVCSKTCAVEPSYPGGDSCCPSCGELLWWFRDRVAQYVGAEQIGLSTSFLDIGADSLDVVELIMELEETFDIQVPEDVAQRIRTVADAIRFIEEHRR